MVTRERLYIDAVESVLSKTSKVMVDVEGGNNLLYLPLDKIVNQSVISGGTLSASELRDLTNRIREQLIREIQSSNNRRGAR